MRDWRAILSKLNRYEFYRIAQVLARKFFSLKGHEGVKVVEEDWDYLFLLDACRCDFFEEVNWLEGDLQKRVSRGSTSIEFLNRNFTDYYGDVVYISANGFVNPLESSNANYQRKTFVSSDHFHEVYPVFMNVETPATPEEVNEALMKAEEEHPNKRKIIHYMQPHLPLDARADLPQDAKYHKLRRKGISKDEIQAGYRDNLEYVLKGVEDAIENLEGRIIVSSDHGELLGEYGLWEHPHGVYLKELVEVPWLVIEKGERPEIKGEDELEGLDI